MLGEFRNISKSSAWMLQFENFHFRNTPLRHQASQPGRTSSIISNVSGGSVPEEFSDDEYDDDDEYDNIDGMRL